MPAMTNPAHPLALAAAIASLPADEASKVILTNYYRVLRWVINNKGDLLKLADDFDRMLGILPNTVDEPSKES